MPIPAIPAAALAVLKSPLLWKAVGLLAVVSVIFIGGCNYGASGKKELQAEFDAYKKAQAELMVATQKANADHAKKANEKLKADERRIEENDRKHQQELARIRADLDRVRLDAALVRLLNDSAALGTDQPPARPDQQEDGSPDENTASGAGPPDHQPTLGDLAEVILENNKNHLACRAQVEAWQLFYTDLYKQFE